MSGLMLGPVVNRVDTDAVGIDVEPVPGRELANRPGRRAHVLAADGYKPLRRLVAGIVLRVGTPERDLERDGIVEQGVVRGQAEPLQLVKRVLSTRVRQPPREVTQLGNDSPEVLLVLGTQWAAVFQ